MTKEELIKALACVDDGKELLCTFSFAEKNIDYPGYITSINISFTGDEANARLLIREIQTAKGLDIAA